MWSLPRKKEGPLPPLIFGVEFVNFWKFHWESKGPGWPPNPMCFCSEIRAQIAGPIQIDNVGLHNLHWWRWRERFLWREILALLGGSTGLSKPQISHGKFEVFSNTILTCTAASSTWPMTLHRFSMEEADVVSYNTSMMPGEITHRKM